MALLASTSPAVAKMLQRWSFKEGTGLGARGQGIVAPIVQRNCLGTGIGYDKTYDNGLPDKAPEVQEEWRRRSEELSRALRLEEKCCNKTIEVLRDMTLEEDDDSAEETAKALAAVVESKKLFEKKRTRAPGMWKATLPSSTTLYIVDHVIKPKMAVDEQEWIPSWECESWIRPWIPLVGHLPDSLYDAVERKIVKHIGVYAVISPWKQYMDPTQWATFTHRHILPWLTRLVRELMITPPKQMDPSFHIVMQWAPLVPAQDVASILEKEQFFERWEDALRHWLQSGAGKPSSEEAVAWCTGWKNLFTPELLADERVLTRVDAFIALVDSEN